MSEHETIPTDWQVPPGFVLTWYPPFTFPTPEGPDRRIFVFDDAEPFVPVPDPASGPDAVGYNPNGSWATLGDYGGTHPGVYALNIAGEEPGVFDPEMPVHADAIQVRGEAL